MGKKKITTFLVAIMAVFTLITVSGCSKRTDGGLIVYNDGCLTNEYLCAAVIEPITYRELLKTDSGSFDFELVKALNKLDENTSLDDQVPMNSSIALKKSSYTKEFAKNFEKEFSYLYE